MPIFHFPFFYNPYYKNFSSKANTDQKNNKIIENTEQTSSENSNIQTSLHTQENNSNYFFELFGLKLQFDDVLLICLLIFLYQEGNRDIELFFSLILLLLS